MSVSVSIVVPVYNRTRELCELLNSILDLERKPQEIVLCEDCSPERIQIRLLVEQMMPKFSTQGISLAYIENEKNLGFDGNLRKCIESATSDWALILGNDDLLLPNALSELDTFLYKHPQVNIVSRAFLRFVDNIQNPIGISSISDFDAVYLRETASPRFIFRACGFIGGLAINTEFARRYSTKKYDGGLYYQIVLACYAFCSGGIGYISKPIAGGRADNPPLFGMASNESSVHVPGGYTAKGRAKMWSSVLEITSDIGKENNIDLVSDIRDELTVRQSFHIFEMNAGSTKSDLLALKNELIKLGLFSHFVPTLLYYINFIFGVKSKVFYKAIRKIIQ